MTNKTYIGKGKQVGTYGSVKVSIKMSDAKQFLKEAKGEEYLNFFINPLKETDKFGNTHTAFVLVEEVAETPEPQTEAPLPTDQEVAEAIAERDRQVAHNIASNIAEEAAQGRDEDKPAKAPRKSRSKK